MIRCEKYPKTSFYTPETCLARQRLIYDQDKHEAPGIIREKGKGHLINCERCVGCNTGQQLYVESKTEDAGKIKKTLKKCSACKEKYPADKNHFDINPKMKDGLSWKCIRCIKSVETIINKQEVTMGNNIFKKRCSRKSCLKEYPATAEYFGTTKKSKDGLGYYCRPCQTAVVKESFLKRKKPMVEAQPILTPLEATPGKINIETQEKQSPFLPLVPHLPDFDIYAPPQIIEPTKTQKCFTCKEELPLTAEYFHRNKEMVTGFRGVCKKCRSDHRPDKVTGPRILLNFEGEAELFEKITALAKKDRRTTDQQILYILEVAG